MNGIGIGMHSLCTLWHLAAGLRFISASVEGASSFVQLLIGAHCCSVRRLQAALCVLL